MRKKRSTGRGGGRWSEGAIVQLATQQSFGTIIRIPVTVVEALLKGSSSLTPTLYRPDLSRVVSEGVFRVRLRGRRRSTHTILHTLYSAHISPVYTPWTKRMQLLMQQLDRTLVVLIVSRKNGVRRVAAETLQRWPFRTELSPKRCRTDSRDGENACERAGGGGSGVLQCHSAQEFIVVVFSGWRKGVMLVLVVWGVRVCAGHFEYTQMEKSSNDATVVA